ncbi:hypothetical protein [Nostoc sp. FACHB-892]|uniref:hypothetical protein n=1 Tax=Nostoc sp. FACHB-892 TaxID=2692843 RepID=UPI001A7ED015|nr:hypothetical protein [Nostoc sp. FACHB-892]
MQEVKPRILPRIRRKLEFLHTLRSGQLENPPKADDHRNWCWLNPQSYQCLGIVHRTSEILQRHAHEP